ncbi:MAG: exodeoxyribonuclease VII large subunit [Dongiaceae bacterium]
MSDSIIATPTPGSNMPEFTVSEISQAVKRTLEGNFERIRVRGEVSKPNYHSSGHLYFSLKDEGAVIDAVCWRGTVGRLPLRLEHGMELVVTGRVSSYPGSSKYQIVVDQAELAGEGALLKMLEERRKRLAAEGLFDAGRKRPLPYLPDVIGVITSPTGAVIRDILHRLADRFPRHVLLWPVAVQGDNAAAQVVAAIAGFNRLQPGGPVPRPDLIIVARGGGSLEDLMPFNDEAVVRAVVASEIPLISAVGHETDTTLIDFASDRRAPTPTAAAEMAVPVRGDLLGEIGESGLRLARAAQRLIAEQKMRLEGLARGLIHPARLLEDMAQRLDGWTERLGQSLKGFFAARTEQVSRASARLVTPQQLIHQKRLQLADTASALRQDTQRMLAQKQQRFAGAVALLRPEVLENLLQRGRLRLESLTGLLDSYSYERVLARGFVLVRDAADHAVSSAKTVSAGAALRLQFADGQVPVTATGGAGKPPPASAPPSATPAPKRKPNDKQGSLL